MSATMVKTALVGEPPLVRVDPLLCFLDAQKQLYTAYGRVNVCSKETIPL